MNLAAGKEGIFFPTGSGPLSVIHMPKGQKEIKG